MKTNGHSYEWHPCRPSHLIKNDRKTECNTDNHIPLVAPGAQATEHQTKVLGDQKLAQVVGNDEQSVVTEILEWLQPFTEGLTRGSSSSTDVSPVDPAAHPPAKLISNRAGRKHILFILFSTDPYCEVCRGCHAEEILMIGRTELRLPKDLEISKQQTTRFSMKNKNLDCVTDLQWSCKTWRRNGFKVIRARPNQFKRRREVFEHSYVQKKTQDPFIRTILGNLLKLAKS